MDVGNRSGNSNITTCVVFQGDQIQCDRITIASIVVGCVAIASCLFVIFIQWLFRMYTHFIQRVILCLIISSALGDVLKIVGDHALDHHGLCVFQAWGWTYTGWSSLFWMCSIMVTIYRTAVMEKSSEKLEKIYHVVSWGMPLVVAAIPFAGDAYGPAGAWCWVKTWQWRFSLWYIPYFSFCTVMFVIYGYIIFKLKQKIAEWRGHFDPQTEIKREMMRQQVAPLRIYPILYLACGVFPAIDRIYNAATNDHAIFGLKLMHAIANPLFGTAAAAAFCLEGDTLKQLHWVNIKHAIQRRLESRQPDQDPFYPDVEQTPHQELSAVKGAQVDGYL